ncbi:MAG: thymidine phosphorylase [Candidatus Pacearchaeota archaeon]
MKLRTKKLSWFAGRPVVILSPLAARRLNVHVNERVLISHNKKKFYAVVDIFSDITKDDEIGFSYEAFSFFNFKKDLLVDVFPADSTNAGQLIKRKMSGETLTNEELRLIIKEISNNNLTEAEIAFFIAAEKMKGMSIGEIIGLTKAMIDNGRRLSWNTKIVADKHCIGGIAGNRTTPLVVSICAAAGLIFPKTSSRAITSAAGTADTIEAIAKVDFTKEEITKIVEKVGGCLVWNGALNLSPSDDKIIHVERMLNLDVEPQLIASIMSKKIAAGSNHIIIDIPYGGGKFSTRESAEELGKRFAKVANYFNVKLRVVYTDGRKPIGNGIGPVLEIFDIIKVLRGDGPDDLKNKALYISSELMDLCGIKNAKQKAREILESGKAYEKFKEIINAQNGKSDFDSRIKRLKYAKYKKDIIANSEGKIKSIDNKKINLLCRILGAPETKTAGVYLHKKEGFVEKNEKIITLYAESPIKLEDGIKYFKEFEPIVFRQA